MRIEQLKCLVDIAQTHSITNTAQRLFMTQPAVSKSMKQLEKEFGVDLLVRTNEGVYLTAFGEEILEHAKSILGEENNMEEVAKKYKMHSVQQDYFNIQASSISSIANVVLPDVISKMNLLEPKFSLKMIGANTMEELLQQVREGQCDIGFFTYHEQEVYRKFAGQLDALQMDILAMDEVLLVASRKQYQDETAETMTDVSSKHLSTIYGIHVIDDVKQHALNETMVISNDIELHRRLIEKNGAVVAMPKLAYHYSFNSKKYMAFPLLNEADRVSLMHGAVYRKDAGDMVKTLATVIRKEMYGKQL